MGIICPARAQQIIISKRNEYELKFLKDQKLKCVAVSQLSGPEADTFNKL